MDLLARPTWHGMIFIEPGSFGAGEKRELMDVGPFYIDVREVTKREFASHLEEFSKKPPRIWPDEDDLPVQAIPWQEAADYARSIGKRLPTAMEWEKAARGTQAWVYPWGNDFDPARANTRKAGRSGPVPAGTFPDESPSGCLDMAGNLREWTATRAENGARIMKGGSYNSNQWFGRTYSSRRIDPRDTSAVNGFRCAADFLPRLIED